MLHFSCDLCGKQLDDRRFVVKLDVFAAYDPDDLDEDDLEADHLQEIADLLSGSDDSELPELEDTEAKSYRYDLCPTCHRQFLKDPLGRDRSRRLKFSEN